MHALIFIFKDEVRALKSEKIKYSCLSILKF